VWNFLTVFPETLPGPPSRGDFLQALCQRRPALGILGLLAASPAEIQLGLHLSGRFCSLSVVRAPIAFSERCVFARRNSSINAGWFAGSGSKKTMPV